VDHTSIMTDRRFPPPWSADETDPCFIVRDANGQALAYIYLEDEPGRRSAAKLLSRRRSAADGGQHRQASGAAEAAGGVGARTQLAPEFARSPHPNKKNPAGLGGKFCWAVRWSGF
jgi:hypothetical protein